MGTLGGSYYCEGTFFKYNAMDDLTLLGFIVSQAKTYVTAELFTPSSFRNTALYCSGPESEFATECKVRGIWIILFKPSKLI